MPVDQKQIPEGLRGAYRAARKAGWTVTRTGGNHLKWTPPGGGRSVITGGTPHTTGHSMPNYLRELRAAGLKC